MRYDYLLKLIAEHKPETILEIGTWNGNRALILAEEALKYRKKVHYIGYDLFQNANEQTDKEEFNVKKHFTVKEVSQKLNTFKIKYNGFTFELHAGNTRDTLKPTKVDFVWLDGGHSVETIRSDYENVKESKLIAFDDYYLPDDTGYSIDIKNFGANVICDELNCKIIESTDKVKNGGYVTIAYIVN